MQDSAGTSMTQDITKGIVRILGSDGSTLGSGFLASSDGLIVTCLHVIQLKQEKGNESQISITVVFQNTSDIRDARIEKLSTASDDLAILRIVGDSPTGLIPLLLGSSAKTSGHRFKTFGYPDARSDTGLWGYGTVGDHIDDDSGKNLLQLTGTTDVTPGFSGAPIFDEQTKKSHWYSYSNYCQG